MINKSYLFLSVSLLLSPALSAMTIVGDSGSASGSTITLSTGAATNANGTANFIASGSTVTFSFDDAFGNLGLGINALRATNPNSGSNNNISIGDFSGESVTSGSNNVIIGIGAGNGLTTGNTNVLLGYDAGGGYTSSEDTNICINDVGITGDMQVIRINSNQSGQGARSCYIGGITNVTLSNPNLVTIDPVSGQLGSATIFTNINQPAFLAYLSTTQSGVTGDGTTYTVIFDTTAYDKASNFNTFSGMFIAPVSGVYHFEAAVNLSGLISTSNATVDLVTNNLTYRLASSILSPTFATDTLGGGVTIQMAQGDIAYIATTVSSFGGLPAVNIEGGSTPVVSYFSGTLLS